MVSRQLYCKADAGTAEPGETGPGGAALGREGRNRARKGGTGPGGPPPISGLGLWPGLPILDDDCLQVEILVIMNGVAVDSLDIHCCDHLCACCSGYLTD